MEADQTSFADITHFDSIENAAYGAARHVADQLGWAVFPCHSIERGVCSCPKGGTCEAPGKHPRTTNGVKDASTDQNYLAAWHSRWPNANWAATPGEDGFVVDIDPRHGGWESVKDTWPGLTSTWSAMTGGGGRHLYFAGDGLRNRTNALPGVDIRANGGYVILPGSRHVSGGVYSWTDNVQPASELPSAPPDVIERLRTAGPGGSFSDQLPTTSDILQGVAEGSRDDTLFRWACQQRRLYGDEIKPLVMLGARYAAAQSDFPQDQAAKCVESAWKQDHDDVSAAAAAWAQRLGEGEGRRGLNLQSADEVRQRPKPVYLIDGVLPKSALFQVFGQTMTFKSFVMLDMAASIANGIPWMGHEVTDPGPAALVLGEGGADAGARLSAWLAAHPGASDSLVVYSIEEQLDLMNADDVSMIVTDLEAYRADRFGDQTWKFIVFDTQADHMASGDEDKSKDFTVVKAAIQRIGHETGAAVGLVHHTGWDKSRERGSSRQRQALDVVMQIDSKTITNIKQKFGPEFAPIRFETVGSAESLYVRQATPEDDMAALAGAAQANVEHSRRALVLLRDRPGLSGNNMATDLGIGKATWIMVRDSLEASGFVQCSRDAKYNVKSTEITELGLKSLET